MEFASFFDLQEAGWPLAQRFTRLAAVFAEDAGGFGFFVKDRKI
jgi:hypothetical protein